MKNTGRTHFKKGIIPWNKGKTGVYSEKTRKNISESLKTKRIIPPSRKGIRLTDEQKKKLVIRKGEHHWNWKGGITSSEERLRKSIEYKLWRTAVFERDNFTCIWCGERGGRLNADHIKPFSLFPELRFAIDNGRTLCVECHKKTETYGCRSWK